MVRQHPSVTCSERSWPHYPHALTRRLAGSRRAVPEVPTKPGRKRPAEPGSGGIPSQQKKAKVPKTDRRRATTRHNDCFQKAVKKNLDKAPGWRLGMNIRKWATHDRP